MCGIGNAKGRTAPSVRVRIPTLISREIELDLTHRRAIAGSPSLSPASRAGEGVSSLSFNHSPLRSPPHARLYWMVHIRD